jgi:hypothetical protein
MLALLLQAPTLTLVDIDKAIVIGCLWYTKSEYDA